MSARHVNIGIVQTVIREARGEHFGAAVRENILRSAALIEKMARREGAPQIVVLPEFFLTGLASTRTHAEALEMARRVPGDETALLGQLARSLGIYLCGATWHYDPEWPDRWFNVAFILGPDGEVALKYHKNNTVNLEMGFTNTAPADVHDEYVARYGPGSLWPVLDTPYGRLGCMVCFDLCFPETARMLALQEVDIVLHPTGEPYGLPLGVYQRGWEAARRARAYESCAYLVSANHGGYVPTAGGRQHAVAAVGDFQEPVAGGITPAGRSRGGSQVVDFEGRVLARIDGQGEAVVQATLDLDALRRARSRRVDGRAWAARPDVAARLARRYAAAPACPTNLLAAGPLTERSAVTMLKQRVVREMEEAGVMVPPGRSPDPYEVCAVQADILHLPGDLGWRDQANAVADHVERTFRLIDYALATEPAPLVCLPDGWPASFPHGGGLALDGPELEHVAEVAERLGIHLAGAAVVIDSVDTQRHRKAGYLFGPSGALLALSPKLVPSDHLRGERFDAAVEDLDALVDAAPAASGRPASPVVETPLGRLAVVCGSDLATFEVPRLLVLQGAEVLLNPTAEPHAVLAHAWDATHAARAFENAAYVVVVNQGRGAGSDAVPADRSRGRSAVIDPLGVELVRSGSGTSIVRAEIVLDALRTLRHDGPLSLLPQLRTAAYAPGYAGRAAMGAALEPGESVAPRASVVAGTYVAAAAGGAH